MRYIYDEKKDVIIKISDYLFDEPIVNVMYNPHTFVGKTGSCVLCIHIEDYDYIKEWYEDIYATNGKQNYKSDYARNLYIYNGYDYCRVMFNSFIQSIEVNKVDNCIINIKMSYDYTKTEPLSNKLKQIYRDHQLNKLGI